MNAEQRNVIVDGGWYTFKRVPRWSWLPNWTVHIPLLYREIIVPADTEKRRQFNHMMREAEDRLREFQDRYENLRRRYPDG